MARENDRDTRKREEPVNCFFCINNVFRIARDFEFRTAVRYSDACLILDYVQVFVE